MSLEHILLGCLETPASGYDLKHLVGRIADSRAYRTSSQPNDSNRLDTQSYARFYPRRLKAEVLLDAFSQVLDVPTVFPGDRGGKFPPGTRAIELPDENVAVHFLDVFGRPDRRSACECERTDDPALAAAVVTHGCSFGVSMDSSMSTSLK